MEKVLLVDDDREVREALAQTLELADLKPVLAGSFIEAKDQIKAQFEGIIVTDIRMPGRDGFHLLNYARETDPDLPVILLTGEADVPMAVQAMAQGAHAFLEKPCAPADLIAAIRLALEQRQEVLAARRRQLQIESGDAAERMLHGGSDLAKSLRSRVRAVARTTAEVLVTGPPGSGIPKVAEVIHLLSPAAHRPFVKTAGGALDVAGLFEAIDKAKGGALYIDEVGNLSAAAQFALLDKLEQGAEARVIAGSTSLHDGPGKDSGFSHDLFYRLDLMRVQVPALRDRPDDIPILFRQYVAQACEQAAMPVPDITPDVLARLMAKEWPGNARALMSAAMRYALGLRDPDEEDQSQGLVAQMQQVERSLLEDALRRNHGRASETAKALKLPRKTFYDKLARHGLRAEDFRNE